MHAEGPITTPVRRGPGRPPKAEAGDTKTALLRSALKLFARHGYAGTSIRAIARDVGLSESVLYAHFAGKQAIFDAAMALAGPNVTVVAIETLDAELADRDPVSYIREFTAAVLAAWDTPEARQLVSLGARDGLMHDPVLSGGIDHALAHLATVCRRWLDNGQVRADVGTADDLAFSLLAPIAHARMLWMHADASPEQREAARGRATRHAALFARTVVHTRPA
ncbi:TetR/AcrR family transcriptional regulator [Streptosporangium sp. 'caverna']|uniref:TetR/AcrR family transcriptional regulator n=1 Tax=Streptosporangium sp. 'caverna' TaxID=2202249 RepID=UPI000D7E93FC|nr:TetR family transcriptional regulator [Streptosporangium sp. 'caverna']AWS44499.1 TetR family transcriptional regulator [Streptosporangium sp. 'caverna']